MGEEEMMGEEGMSVETRKRVKQLEW